jgi:glycerol-3-phosphate dehydrogenase
MAEKVSDLVGSKLGSDAPGTTAHEPLPGSEDEGEVSWPEGLAGWEARALETRHGTRAGQVAGLGDLSRVCVCETVSDTELRFAVRRLFARTLDDLRRRTRMGMGPCQGSTCAPRASAILADELGLDPATADRLMVEFIRNRLRGRLAVVTHGGAAQEELIRSVQLGLAGEGE